MGDGRDYILSHLVHVSHDVTSLVNGICVDVLVKLFGYGHLPRPSTTHRHQTSLTTNQHLQHQYML